MAMRLARSAPRALVVPDPAFWAAAGVDVAGLGVEPVASPERADLMLLPSVVPRGLEDAVREARARLRDPDAVRIKPGLSILGEDLETVLAHEPQREREEEESEDDEDGEEHDDHDHDHDHDDMMAVTGDPSSDGLVMEDAEATIGPLGPALATGIVWHATLDGDVVCKSQIESALRDPAGAGAALDPLAPISCRWALERAGAAQLEPRQVALRVAAVELERALSHVTWLTRFAYTLGRLALADRLRRGCAPLIEAHRALLRRPDDAPALREILPLRNALRSAIGSRSLRMRATRAGIVDEEHEARRAGGPVARAAGIEEDARSADRAYRELGFAPVLRSAGDAEARMLVRVDEASASLELAEAALGAGELPPDAGPVEGPRGPLEAQHGGPSGALAAVAPGGAALVELAAQSARGHELARAVTAIGSFDLSPGIVTR
jgi:hypothetical protein